MVFGCFVGFYFLVWGRGGDFGLDMFKRKVRKVLFSGI